jgi:hypothetical protein
MSSGKGRWLSNLEKARFPLFSRYSFCFALRRPLFVRKRPKRRDESL